MMIDGRKNNNLGIISFGRLTVCSCSYGYTPVPQRGKVHLQGAKGAFQRGVIKSSEFCTLEEDEDMDFSLHHAPSHWCPTNAE